MAVAGALLVLLIGGANAYVLLAARGGATADIGRLHHAEAGIVLGALVQPDGRMSAMLADRVREAVALWKAGKVDRLIVSGDHHTFAYDEPDTMRKALVHAGVPWRVIFEDHAGFDTWASMVRARRIFGVRSAIVVTQGFHMPRALLLAGAAGLRAQGLTADLRGYGDQGLRSQARELLARVKAVGQAALKPGVLLGPRRPLSADGRSTLGPVPPPGTPPAGSPGR